MYGKWFESAYDGTLVDNWEALVTLQQMVVLCDADGTLDMTPRALHRRTGIPLEILLTGIEILEKPDPDSRTPDEDGRRIVRLDEHRDWGWHIVNHAKYRSLASAEEIREGNRERKRRQREREAMSRDVTECHAPSRMSRHTDTGNKKQETEDLGANAPCRNATPFDRILALFHETLPQLPRVEVVNEGRKRAMRARWRDELPSLEHWSAYFEAAAAQPKLYSGAMSGWRASFDWLLKPANLAKVWERNYAD